MTGFDVSLPMYNLPEMAELNAAFWVALADELRREGVGDLPESLSFARPAVPDEIGAGTIFTQTCGYPLQTIYTGQYALLGVPTYDAPGCEGPNHSALILVRDDAPFTDLTDLRGSVFALNSRHSNSGMNLPRVMIARLAKGRPFFGNVVETGTHPLSMASVTEGRTDAASIDCLTYAFFQEHRPKAVERLRVLTKTPSSPAIPFVTSSSTPPATIAALRRSLFRVAADPARRAMLAKLRISSIDPVEPATYARLLDYEREAAALGYPEIV